MNCSIAMTIRIVQAYPAVPTPLFELFLGLPPALELKGTTTTASAIPSTAGYILAGRKNFKVSSHTLALAPSVFLDPKR